MNKNVCRNKRNNRINRRTGRSGLIVSVLTLVLVLVFSLNTGTLNSKAENTSNANLTKCYKSIEINKGDSLWSISEEYMNETYDSVYDYMAELIEINQMEEHEIDNLTEGEYIIVSYYM